jgi:hypothetical protein
MNCYTRHISNSNVKKEENYTLGFCPKICPTFAHPDSFFFPCIFLEINVRLNAIDDSVGKALRTADLYVYCVCQRSYHSHLPLILALVLHDVMYGERRGACCTYYLKQALSQFVIKV